MSQLSTDWQDFAGDPRLVTYPLDIISVVTVTFSGSYFIKANHDGAPQNAWFVGPRDRLSWLLRGSPSAHRGGSINLHVFPTAEGNPALTQQVWRTYQLVNTGNTAGAPMNTLTGLKVPHQFLYIELVSGENNWTVTGCIKLEAG